jgi:hypothetical protein
MTYDEVCNKSNSTNVTSGAGPGPPSGANGCKSVYNMIASTIALDIDLSSLRILLI